MVAEVKNYYELLGISRRASGEEIRKAFRKLARQFHPDLARDKLVAEEKFKEINEAYEVLNDAETRRKYDSGEGRWRRFSGFGSHKVKRQNGKFHGSAPSDTFRPYTERPEFRSFYEEFINRRHQKTNRSSASDAGAQSQGYERFHGHDSQPQRGKDIEGEVLISLEEVLHGSIHTLSVLRQNPVTGEAERRFLHVKIPSGAQEAQILRLPGKGDYGIAGGVAGDLHLRIKVAAHPGFRVRGADVLCDLELTAWEAFFGAQKRIRTLEGPVCLKIPRGTIGGHRLRLRGKGLPKADGSRGDLYAVVTVKVPFRRMVRKVFGR